MLSNWRYSTVQSQSTTDVGYATVLLTTQNTPRVVTQLCAYNGTSTTAVNMRYYIYPATSVVQDGNGQIQIADNLSFPLGFMNADLTAAANSETDATPAIPFGAKGASMPFFIIPENCLLVAAPYTANQNGTVTHKVISAELGLHYA